VRTRTLLVPLSLCCLHLQMTLSKRPLPSPFPRPLPSLCMLCLRPFAPLGPPSYNQLGEGGAFALAKALELNTSLTELYLGYAHGCGCAAGQVGREGPLHCHEMPVLPCGHARCGSRSSRASLPHTRAPVHPPISSRRVASVLRACCVLPSPPVAMPPLGCSGNGPPADNDRRGFNFGFQGFSAAANSALATAWGSRKGHLGLRFYEA
jgi:hypothetical protein